MHSTDLVQSSQWFMRGVLATGLLCGAGFAEPPEKETSKSALVRKTPGGGSALGAVLQLLVGAPAKANAVRTDGEPDPSDAASEPVVFEAAAPVQEATPWNLPGATHKQTQTVSVKGSGGHSLQTFCVTPSGDLVAVVAPPRYGAARSSEKSTSSLQMFDGRGEALRDWTVDFVVQAVTAAPDGSIIAAGSGQIAKYSATGELIKHVELQHVKDALADKDKLRKGAEELVEAQREQIESFFKDQKEQLQKRIDTLQAAEKEADEGKLSKTKARQLAAAQRSLKQIQRQQDQMGGRQTVEDVMRDLTSRLRIVNSVTASKDDIFIACGVMNGYGFAVWRMTHEFEDPQQVIKGLSGCCGQMDIQCQDGELFVAENSRHRVVCYNRDGKQLRTFGGRMGQKGGQFGGCCNPMNLCFDKDGSVLTAESEGIVRKFSATGESLGAVGGCKLTGGCKNVAVGISPDGKTVYFCDQPGSKIIIMARTETDPEAAQEKSSQD